MRADFVSIVLCGPTNGCEDCDAEANDGGGQHDPVYGDSTVFVAVEGFDQVEQFHGLSPVGFLFGFSFARPARVLLTVVRLGKELLTFKMGRDWGRYGTISKRVIFF